MSLSSNNLEAFYICAQLGHFTKAAEKLNITQSAISQRVMNLEQELETSLFYRERSGIRLTEAGLSLMRYCQAQFALQDEVLQTIRGVGTDLSGYIRIGGFSSVLRSAVLPALAPILKQYPSIKLSLVSAEMNELPQLFKNGQIDYMLLDEQWHSEHVSSIHLGEEKTVMIAPKKEPRKKADQPQIFLDHDEEDKVTLKYLEMIGDERPIERRYLDDVYGIIDGVRLGIGRAVVPMHLVKADSSIKIVDRSSLVTPVVLHFYTQPFYSKLHSLVVDTLTSEVHKLLR